MARHLDPAPPPKVSAHGRDVSHRRRVLARWEPAVAVAYLDRLPSPCVSMAELERALRMVRLGGIPGSDRVPGVLLVVLGSVAVRSIYAAFCRRMECNTTERHHRVVAS